MQITRDCHMTADLAQPRKHSNVTRPSPCLRAGSGHKTSLIPDDVLYMYTHCISYCTYIVVHTLLYMYMYGVLLYTVLR